MVPHAMPRVVPNAMLGAVSEFTMSLRLEMSWTPFLEDPFAAVAAVQLQELRPSGLASLPLFSVGRYDTTC